MGYRAQALFAAVLGRLGAQIEDVARVGHPDVLARLGGRRLRVQVKCTGSGTFGISSADLEGIRPAAAEEEGYLAMLDLGPPVAWICVAYSKIRSFADRPLPLAMLVAMADPAFSDECTGTFAELIIEYRDSIEAFTFSLVRRRALSGH